MAAEAKRTTVDDAEVERFSAMAAEWWNPNGKFRPLHKFNPVRLAYIRDQVAARFGRDAHAARPFEGLRFLDIGCGGGLRASRWRGLAPKWSASTRRKTTSRWPGCMQPNRRLRSTTARRRPRNWRTPAKNSTLC